MKTTKQELERKLKEALAGQAHVYHFAEKELSRISTDKLAGSGVILTITALGGKEAVEPVLIRDGLSIETINAIKNNLKRSYDLAVMFKPSGSCVKGEK